MHIAYPCPILVTSQVTNVVFGVTIQILFSNTKFNSYWPACTHKYTMCARLYKSYFTCMHFKHTLLMGGGGGSQ